MSWLSLLCGALAGGALRLYVQARRERRKAETAAQARSYLITLEGISQARVDTLLSLPGAPPLQDAEAVTQYLADCSGESIVARERYGDGLFVAVPREQR
jgi:hypothetical protein